MRKLTLLLPLLLLATPFARAESPALDVQNFQPHADQLGWFATHSAATLDLWQPAFGVWFSYARDPLQYEYEDGTRDSVVDNLATADVQAAIGFRHAELAVDMPVHLRVTGDGRAEWGGGFASTSAGDLRIVPKVRFLDASRAGVGLGLVLPLSFPSGNEAAYTGRPTVAFSPMLTVSAPIGPVRVGGNIGYRLSGKTELGDLISGDAFLYRVGVGVAAAEMAEFVAEVYGEVHSQDRNNPVEWLGGVVFRPMPTVAVRLAGGTSIGHGIGAPEGRVVVGIGWCARAPADSDGDGILDARDICPDEPETKNGFQDDDGCPDEADRDDDGIMDADDDCPEDPEDKEGW